MTDDLVTRAIRALEAGNWDMGDIGCLTAEITRLSEELERRDAWQDRAVANAMHSVCNDIMATVVASSAPDGGANGPEAKLDRICAKVEAIRKRANAASEVARATLKESIPQ